MPFTIAHAAAAEPIDRLLGRQVSTLALAVGTLAPDLEFFIRGRSERSIGHDLHGTVLLDLPLAFVFLAALSWLVVPAIVTLLPDNALHLGPALRRSFTVPLRRWGDPSALARLAVAILIGAGSHLLWDDFTSEPPPETASLQWLTRFPFSLGGADHALHSILRWASTVGGLILVGLALRRWLERQPRQIPADALLEPIPPKLRRGGLAFIAIVTVAFAVQHPLAFVGDGPARPDATADILAATVSWALAGCFVALALFGAALQLGVLEARDPSARSGDRASR